MPDDNKQSSKSKLRRLTLEVTAATDALINKLQKQFDLKSHAAVIRKALRLLDLFSEEKAKGNRLAVLTPQGDVTIIEFL